MAEQKCMAYSAAPVAIALVEIGEAGLGAVLCANRAFAQLSGRSETGLQGVGIAEILHPEDRMLLDLPLTTTVEAVQVRVLHPQRGVVWAVLAIGGEEIDPVSGCPAVVVSLQDVTKWREMEERLAHAATHDVLTGLANRSMLMDHLEHALARLARRSGTLAVLFCDLDGFKELNDTFGHRLGDKVLQEAAQRITRAVRAEDAVVRMGGDEFVIVCEATDPSESGRVAERIRTALEVPIRLGDRDFTVGVSVGIAQVSENSSSPEDLVRRADLAMYRAKQLGRNRVEVFNPDLEHDARSRIEIVERVRAALATGGIAIDLQAVVDLATGTWVGSEALARIRQPGGQRLLPAAFLGTVRNTGLLERIDARVREQAIGWLARRGAEGPGWVSVNVTAGELDDPRFPAAVEAELDAAGLRPSQLMLDLAESAIADMHGPLPETLRRLRSIGCLVAIDDFGSGRSSLTSLRDVSSDVIKIDRSFIAGIGRNSHDEAIIEAIVSVAHRLGRVVVAKGVERPEQADLLRAIGCEWGQGYLFGPPAPPATAPAAE